MSTSVTTVEQLSEAIGAANSYIDDEHARSIVVALYKLLAQGQPVSVAELATHAGVPEVVALARLKAWPGVFWGGDRVVGFWGIAIPEMPIRFHAEGGKSVYAWCALDPFLIVPAIGLLARVESKDPVTGELVTMTVTPEGIKDLSPASAVVSFIAPDKPFTYDVIETFCNYVLNFTSRDSAERWAAERENIIVLPTSDAFEVGRRALGIWWDRTAAANLQRREPTTHSGPIC